MREKEQIRDVHRMRSAKIASLIWCCTAVALSTCTRDPGRAAADDPRFEQPDTVLLGALVDSMRDARTRGDSLYCDSLLPQFQSTRLARLKPELVVNAYLNLVWTYGHYPQDAKDRMEAIVASTKSDKLRAWHEYLLGYEQLRKYDLADAMASFQEALARFRSIEEHEGVVYASEMIALMYLDLLGQPELAFPYLYIRLGSATTDDGRARVMDDLCWAFCRVHQTDSARKYALALETLLPRREQAQPGSTEPRILLAWRQFDIALLMATDDSAMDLANVRACYGTLSALLRKYRTRERWNALTPCVAYAELLLVRNEMKEAEKVLAAGQLIVDSCWVCSEVEPGFYAACAELHKRKGETAIALSFQEKRLKALEAVKVSERQMDVQRSKDASDFKQRQAASAMAAELEREQARSAIERIRTQRIILVVVSLFILVIAALLVNRYRLRRRLQVAQLRATLSRDLHDDIGSTLSSISILSNVARKRVEATGDADAAASLAKITDRSQRLMRNMSDIVWSVDPKKDTLEELIVRMREFATSVLEAKGIAYTMDLPAIVPAMNLSAEVKNNLYLIFKEAINNVVKHAGACRVQVRIAFEEGTLRLAVKDDGAGIEERASLNGPGGNGLRNMRARADEMKAALSIEGSKGHGTELSLVLSL